jgi:hypothetical protein
LPSAPSIEAASDDVHAGVAEAIARVERMDARLAALMRDALSLDRGRRPPARAFARRAMDLAVALGGALAAFVPLLEVPESLDGTLLRTVAPPPLPGRTRPRTGRRAGVVERPAGGRGVTSRRRSPTA